MLELAPGALDALIDPALEPLFLRPSRIGPDSAWYGHLPFAAWIMRAARPSQFVELGTHAGISYAGFCDAVLDGHLPTRCLAVDTWQGDEHAGFYGEEVLAEFSRFHDQRYGAFLYSNASVVAGLAQHDHRFSRSSLRTHAHLAKVVTAAMVG